MRQKFIFITGLIFYYIKNAGFPVRPDFRLPLQSTGKTTGPYALSFLRSTGFFFTKPGAEMYIRFKSGTCPADFPESGLLLHD